MTGQNARTSDDDLFVLLIVGMLSLGAIGTAIAVAWDTALRWLLEHQVLVAAGQHPLLPVPYSRGAGLDAPRVAIAAAALVLLLVCAVGWVRGQLALRAAQQLQ